MRNPNSHFGLFFHPGMLRDFWEIKGGEALEWRGRGSGHFGAGICPQKFPAGAQCQPDPWRGSGRTEPLPLAESLLPQTTPRNPWNSVCASPAWEFQHFPPLGSQGRKGDREGRESLHSNSEIAPPAVRGWPSSACTLPLAAPSRGKEPLSPL